MPVTGLMKAVDVAVICMSGRAATAAQRLALIRMPWVVHDKR